MNYLVYAEIAAALYFIWMATTMHGNNTMSNVVFKLVPMLITIGLILDALARFGWVVKS